MNGCVDVPKCIKLKRRKEQACIAAMNERIDIELRQIVAVKTEIVDFDEEFINRRTVWASVDTKGGTQFFDENNILQIISHVFIIRFIPDVTFEDFVIFKNIRYRIVQVENLQQSDTYYRLRCTVRGTDTIEVTKV